MKYLHPVAAVPNELINDSSMHFSTKKVALALLFLSGRKRRAVHATIAELADISRCSTATVQQAISELIQGGYILKSRCYRYGEEQNRLIYAANAYIWVKRLGGYTLLRREILNHDMTPAALSVLLFLYRCGGRSGRAFPSIRHIAGKLSAQCRKGLDMAKSTVARALAELRCLQAIVRHRCWTKRSCYAANSYYLSDMVISDGRQSHQDEPDEFPMGGSPIFDKLRFNNQITGAYTLEEEEKGVGQFGTLHKTPGWFDEGEDYWFDGVGVKVFSCGEQDLTA